jgi:chromosome segregation ATPase
MLVGLIAASLLIGTGLGYVLGMPQRNDLEDDIEGLEDDIEGLEDDIEGLEDERSEAQSNLKTATDARDVCAQAASDADDHLTLTSGYIDTVFAWVETPLGSPEETELESELTALENQMAEQGEILDDKLADCRAGAQPGDTETDSPAA